MNPLDFIMPVIPKTQNSYRFLNYKFNKLVKMKENIVFLFVNI